MNELRAKGYNPLRWNCERRGCFNRIRRPKIEVFCDCFPRRINFTDIDGVVEVNSSFLWLEWKSSSGDEIPTGQRILFERLTKTGSHTVFVVQGDPESMHVRRFGVVYRGRFGGWMTGDLRTLKVRMRRWAMWAQATARAA